MLYCEKHFKYENKRRNQSIPFTFLPFLFQLTLFKAWNFASVALCAFLFLDEMQAQPLLVEKPQQSSLTLARNTCSVSHLIDRHSTSNGLQFQTMVLVFTRILEFPHALDWTSSAACQKHTWVSCLFLVINNKTSYHLLRNYLRSGPGLKYSQYFVLH